MSKNKKTRTNHNILPGFEEFNPAMLDVGDDPSLEAEFLELMGGGGNLSKKPVRNKKEVKPLSINKDLLDLDLNDINDEEIDENDPDLLDELNNFLKEDEPEENPTDRNVIALSSSEAVKKLENLKQLYQEAIKQSDNDPSKSRRYERSLNQINEFLKKAKSGQQVNESDFPPMVSVKPSNPVTLPSQSVLPTPSVSEPPNKSPKLHISQKEAIQVEKSEESSNKIINALRSRQAEYKHAAVEAKSRDIELAKGLLITMKIFDDVIEDVKKGEPFDLNDMPGPPSEFKLANLNSQEETVPTVPVVPIQDKPKISSTSLEEELKLRQKFYKDSMATAKLDGNDSKARRLGRLVQQYDEAIEAFKKNQSYNYEELPPPPGREKLSGPTQPALAVTKQQPVATVTKQQPVATVIKQPSKVTKTLLERQAQFKSAALKAKQEGDLPLAKELLKQSKGIEQMILASESGLPINLASLPTLPANENDWVNIDECEIPVEMLSADKSTLFKQLQITLLEQIKTCQKYGSDVSKAGDIIGARRFESLAKSCEKDLNGLKCLIVQKDSEIPKFHYEYKVFSVLQSNPDLGETEMAVDVIKGIDFAIPSGYSADQLDTYIVLELPFPNDAFQTMTTETIKHTNSPIYNANFKFQINLKSRVFQRVCKSKHLKADIYYKKGIFQKDKLLGTSTIKLEKLESQCNIHELFDIHENRKLIGGKLEMKIRIRMPLSGSQSDTMKEKWLVIDDFNKKNVDLSKPAVAISSNLIIANGSIEVLKFEIGELTHRLNAIGGQMNAAQINLVKQTIQQKESIVRLQEQKSNSTDASVRMAYLQSISSLPQEFNSEAKKFLSENNRDKAQISVTKKKIVEKEIERLKGSRY